MRNTSGAINSVLAQETLKYWQASRVWKGRISADAPNNWTYGAIIDVLRTATYQRTSVAYRAQELLDMVIDDKYPPSLAQPAQIISLHNYLGFHRLFCTHLRKANMHV